MAQTIRITATVPAWLPSYRNPVELLDTIQDGQPVDAIQMIAFAPVDMSGSGWVQVGSADVTLTIASRDEAIAQAVSVLNAKLQEERAESQRRQQAILAQISKLQALTYEAA